MRTVKKIIPFFLATVMALLVCFTAAAPTGAEEQRVFDLADLLTEQEISRLEQRIGALRDLLQLDIVIVTTADAGGKSARDYADDYYDNHGFGAGGESDGLLLLIDMDNREAYISTAGVAIDIFTDARIYSILDDGVIPHLADADYYGAGAAFLDAVSNYGQSGVPDDQYRIDESEVGETGFAGRLKRSLSRSPVYILISVIVAAIAVGIMAALNRGTVKTTATTYLDQNSFNVLDSRDNLVNTHVSKTKISSSSSGGAGGSRSTTHRSSSGRTHGGGGRKF